MSSNGHLRHLYGPLGDLCTALDAIDPGFLGYVTRLPHRRKQVALCVLAITGEAVLSRGTEDGAASPISSGILALVPVAKAIRRMNVRELLATYIGHHEDGLIGALEKLPPRVNPPACYRSLADIFTDLGKRPVAAVVRQLQALTAERVAIILALDPLFLTPTFVEKVGTVRDARDLSTALTLIRNTVAAVDNAALAASIRDIGPDTSLKDWVGGWLRRANRVPHPRLILAPEYVPLDSGPKLVEAARRYRVCLGDPERLLSALRGRAFYWEHRRRGVIVEVEAIGPDQSFLILSGVHSTRNKWTSASTRADVERDFRRAGVVPTHWMPEDTPWSAVGRLVANFYGIRNVEEDEFLAEVEALEAAE